MVALVMTRLQEIIHICLLWAVDYVVFPCNLFSYISNFIVHDFQSCSTHIPIQSILNVYYTGDDSSTSGAQSFSQHDKNGIKWKPELALDYSNLLFSELTEIDSTVEKNYS